MANKYFQAPDIEIDLHGHTTAETKTILDNLLHERRYKMVRLIVGKGNNSANGPVLPDFVRTYLVAHDIRYNQAKIQNGGAGAMDIFLK